MIGCDFNARLGADGAWMDEEYNKEIERKSQDKKDRKRKKYGTGHPEW